MKLILFTFMVLLSGCGKQGTPGAQGTTGIPGNPGTSCSVTTLATGQPGAPNGGSLISCPTSSSLVLNGTPGIQGASGTPGTVITPVQFCPGTTSYPNEFNEIGFCIDGNIYAVYSANGGFLTEVPKGEYQSTGINNSCNFQVLDNCVIQNN